MGKILIGLIIFLIFVGLVLWLVHVFAPKTIHIHPKPEPVDPDLDLEVCSRRQLQDARDRLVKRKAALKNLTELAAINEQLLKIDQALAKTSKDEPDASDPRA